MKNKAKIKYVSFFNNGKIVKDNGRMERSFNKANDSYQSELLLETMVDGAKLYSSFYDFDSIDMHLILGLVFNEQDITVSDEPGLGIKGSEAGTIQYL